MTTRTLPQPRAAQIADTNRLVQLERDKGKTLNEAFRAVAARVRRKTATISTRWYRAGRGDGSAHGNSLLSNEHMTALHGACAAFALQWFPLDRQALGGIFRDLLEIAERWPVCSSASSRVRPRR